MKQNGLGVPLAQLPAATGSYRQLPAATGLQALKQYVQRLALEALVVEPKQPGGVVGISGGADRKRDPVARATGP